MSGILYVVATPIGNLEDLSRRAQKTLAEVDWIACEDTRHTGRLLHHLGIERPLTSYHEHNEETKTRALIGYLNQGQDIALVSDAGTPLLSDPGYRLVHSCRESEISVVPIPGPFAGAAALSVSGLPTDSFLFAGFLPSRKAARRKKLEELSLVNTSIVLYLPPHRLKSVLEEIRQTLGNRRGFLIREMTKLHETSFYGDLGNIAEQLAREKPRGEYTLILEGRSAGQSSPQIDPAIYAAGLISLYGLSRKDAVQRTARELEYSRREVYSRVVEALE